MAEYRRGTGPDALPQGAAKALNDAQVGELAMENADIPVQFQPGNRVEIPDQMPGNDDLQILLDGPDRGYQPPLLEAERSGALPAYVVRHLPELIAAARDPDAPPTLIALKNYALRQAELDARSRR